MVLPGGGGLSALSITTALLVAAPAQAGLIARDIDGNSVTDAYYDTDLNITWLSNANINGPMNWSAASAWANSLMFGAYSDWRLPKGDACHLGPCTSSTNEMSHLYYFELGNPEGGPMSNKGGFANVQPDYYWTNKIVSPGWASEVSFSNGDTGHLPISFLKYAMAVRDGDVATTAPTMVGALPTPENFTSQVVQFALNNIGTLTTIASQNGNNTFQVAESTKEQLNPASNKYLKDIASFVADGLDWFTDKVSIVTSAYDALAVKLTEGWKGAVKSFVKSQAVDLGFNVAYEIAERSGNGQSQRAVLLGDLSNTIINDCLISVATAPPALKVSTFVACDAKLVSFVIDNGIVPGLQLYAIDPPNPNYKTVATVNIPITNVGSSALQPTIDALLTAQAYLAAVNDTYDRYVSAYNAGDTESALLQIQAYLTFLEQYNNAVLQAKQGIAAILNGVVANNVDVDQADLQALIAQVQLEISANGLDSDTVEMLSGLGLDSAQILEVQSDILAFQYSPTGSLRNKVNGLLSGLDAISVPNDVPAPGTLYLVVLAFPLAWFVIRRKRTIPTFEQASAHFHPYPQARCL